MHVIMCVGVVGDVGGCVDDVDVCCWVAMFGDAVMRYGDVAGVVVVVVEITVVVGGVVVVGVVVVVVVVVAVVVVDVAVVVVADVGVYATVINGVDVDYIGIGGGVGVVAGGVVVVVRGVGVVAVIVIDVVVTMLFAGVINRCVVIVFMYVVDYIGCVVDCVVAFV